MRTSIMWFLPTTTALYYYCYNHVGLEKVTGYLVVLIPPMYIQEK